MIVFERSFSSKHPDVGERKPEAGDVVTFFDGCALYTRVAAEVKGAIVVTEPFPGEKPWFVKLELLAKIERADPIEPQPNPTKDGEFCPRCDMRHDGPCLDNNLHDWRVAPREVSAKTPPDSL